MTLKITHQGTAVVEAPSTPHGDWLLLLPNGEVRPFVSQEAAEDAAQFWFRRSARGRKLAVGLGIMETRL
jgi:hypothetical protein